MQNHIKDQEARNRFVEPAEEREENSQAGLKGIQEDGLPKPGVFLFRRRGN